MSQIKTPLFIPSVTIAPDPRDEAYTVAKQLGDTSQPFQNTSANYAVGPVLDQGYSQQCLAYGMKGLLACEPFGVNIGDPERLYAAMCAIDGRQHSPVDTGSTLNAAMQVCVNRGFFKSYLWCKGATEIWRFLTDPECGGPVGLAFPWFQDMELLRADGTLNVPAKLDRANILGGHFMYISACRHDASAPRQMLFRLNNSRGPAWGNQGRCWLDFTDASRLLLFGSQAAAPTKIKFEAK